MNLFLENFPMSGILLIYTTPLNKAGNFYKLLCDITFMTHTLQKYCKNAVPVQQTTFITRNDLSV
jgi:hypothetical protein